MVNFNTSLVTFFFFLLLSQAKSFNITSLLNHYSSFSNFNNYLTQTGVAAEINARRTLTVLVVENNKLSPLKGMSQDAVANVMRVHVLLEYYDVPKMQMLPNKTMKTPTLFQMTGYANNDQGFLNMTDLGVGSISLGSATKGEKLESKLIKSIASQPYNISILQVSNVIIPSGIDSPTPASPPPSSPPTTAPTSAPISSAPTYSPASSPQGSSAAPSSGTDAGPAPESEAAETPTEASPAPAPHHLPPKSDAPTAETPASGSADAPSTNAPSSDAPSASAPSSDAPSTDAPSSDAPSAGAPSAGAPSSDAPSAGAPSAGAPSTDTPSTGAPSSGAPSSGTPEADAPSDDAPALAPTGDNASASSILGISLVFIAMTNFFLVLVI